MRELLQIEGSDINTALKPVITGSDRSFYDDVAPLLANSQNYSRMMEQAILADLDDASVEAGFIAGLKTAFVMLDLQAKFAGLDTSSQV